MLVAVIGGKLQGIEAAYLAKKAGWQVWVIDRKTAVPAAGLCDRFKQVNITTQKDLEHALKGVDLVIPALENADALDCLNRFSFNSEIPLAFDPVAYSLSSSKLKSDSTLCPNRSANPPALAAMRFSGVGQTQPRKRQPARKDFSQLSGFIRTPNQIRRSVGNPGICARPILFH